MDTLSVSPALGGLGMGHLLESGYYIDILVAPRPLNIDLSIDRLIDLLINSIIDL